MRALALLALTLPAADPDAVRRWWASELGLPAGEDDPAALDLGELLLTFGPAPAVRVAADVAEPVRLLDPSGTVVDVVPPDVVAAAEAEESIRAFVGGSGPAVDGLADDVTAVVRAAQARIAALLADVPANTVLATQLALGQRARAETSGVDVPWHLHAASTLVSGLVTGRG